MSSFGIYHGVGNDAPNDVRPRTELCVLTSHLITCIYVCYKFAEMHAFRYILDALF